MDRFSRSQLAGFLRDLADDVERSEPGPSGAIIRSGSVSEEHADETVIQTNNREITIEIEW